MIVTCVCNKSNRPNPILDGSVSCPVQNKEATPEWPTTPDDWKEYAEIAHHKMFNDLWLIDGNKCLTGVELDKYLTYESKILHHRLSKKLGDPLTDDECEEHMMIMEKKLVQLDKEISEKKKPNKTHQNYELGAREFTFTYSPEWYTDDEAREVMTRAIDRLCNYYAQDILVLHARGEVGKNKLSHIHCYYELKGGLKMTDKNFKRAYPRWNPKKKFGKGFEGGHHETVKDKASFIGYINEDAFNWLKKDIDNRT